MTTRARSCIWLDGDGREAVDTWTALVPGSRLESVTELTTPQGEVVSVIDFVLAGTPYQVMDASRPAPVTMAHSISLSVPDQDTLDAVWEGLLADGGDAQACSWLTDRFGVSWQIVPENYWQAMSSPHPEVRQAAAEALWGMVKIDAAEIDAAVARAEEQLTRR